MDQIILVDRINIHIKAHTEQASNIFNKDIFSTELIELDIRQNLKNYIN